jgi:hypothetical protein
MALFTHTTNKTKTKCSLILPEELETGYSKSDNKSQKVTMFRVHRHLVKRYERLQRVFGMMVREVKAMAKQLPMEHQLSCLAKIGDLVAQSKQAPQKDSDEDTEEDEKDSN